MSERRFAFPRLLVLLMSTYSLLGCNPSPESEVTRFFEAVPRLAGKDMNTGFNLMREHLGYSAKEAEFGLEAAKSRGEFKGSLGAQEDACEENQYFMTFHPGGIDLVSEISPIVRRFKGEPDGEKEHAHGEFTPVWFVNGGLVQAQNAFLTYWSGDPLNRAESRKLPRFPLVESVNQYFSQAAWASVSTDKDAHGTSRYSYVHPALESKIFDTPLQVDLYVRNERLRLLRFRSPHFSNRQEFDQSFLGETIAEIIQELGLKEQAASIQTIMGKADQAISGNPQEQFVGNFAISLHCTSPALPVHSCYIDVWRRSDLIDEKCSSLITEGF